MSPMGGKACLSLFGNDPEKHRLLADHLTSEIGIPVSAKDRTVVEWKWKPGRPDNHWLDCVVGCHVAASAQGVSVIAQTPRAAQSVAKFKDSKKTRKVWRANHG
jgi:phage terminase large subunit GpA-like protein